MTNEEIEEMEEILGMIADKIKPRNPDKVQLLMLSEQGIPYSTAVLLRAVTLAYKKHHMGDESIGWEELSNEMHIALCEVLGNDGYRLWLEMYQLKL